jgi:hypothetical protein
VKPFHILSSINLQPLLKPFIAISRYIQGDGWLMPTSRHRVCMGTILFREGGAGDD